MKNKFFKIMCEELENEKNSKKIDILKTSLFLYMTVISKVICEELEVLKNTDYQFLEYLDNLGFTYNLKENYLENLNNLYKIDVTADDENVFIMEKIADKRFKKIGGDYDYDSTIKLLIQDFRTQKFGLITLDNYNDMINEEVSDEN